MQPSFLYAHARHKVTMLQTLIMLGLSLTTAGGANHLLLISLLALRTNARIINRRRSGHSVHLTNMLFFILTLMSIKHLAVWQGLPAPVLYLDAVILCACTYALLGQQQSDSDFNADAAIIAVGASACLFLFQHFLLTGPLSGQELAAADALLALTTSVLLILILYFDYLKLLMPQKTLCGSAGYLAEQSKWLLVLYALFKVAAEAFDIHSVYQQVFGFAAILLLLFVLLTVLPLRARLWPKGHNLRGLLLALPLCLLPVLLDCCFSGQHRHAASITALFYQLCPLLLLCLSYAYALLTFCRPQDLQTKGA
ncbi:hypothetical protein SG34_005910 [Thalassomonas viridans]|uniref:Uncharacterized protein n=1 Tax=Thalassomonas viridans TaxID=137584 RepID=A0AAE9Z5J4_9GAMM|nr:hypothetical protein [Thalassomonas viridans]WDE06454.1 hypothetical protein SG34_005910 [Thalassomonas viridans]